MLKNPYYYGDFEYPKDSGKWYKGKHEPLITKELFEEVRKALVVPAKPKWGAKKFPFKGFIKCYSCGSSLMGSRNYESEKTELCESIYIITAHDKLIISAKNYSPKSLISSNSSAAYVMSLSKT